MLRTHFCGFVVTGHRSFTTAPPRFTFSRSECPCPRNFTGEHRSFDPAKHWQVRDLSLRRSGDAWVLWVRFKAIKQDPRIERPEARHADPNLPADMHAGDREDSKDWVPIGDVPSEDVFSIAKWYMRYTQLMGRAREPDEPFFLAADGVRPFGPIGRPTMRVMSILAEASIILLLI